jgi:hypothetical protein
LERRLTSVPLRLGPLAPPGFLLRRSGIRWLREAGATVRPGEAVAVCNVGLQPQTALAAKGAPFAEEGLDLQVVMASRVGGRLIRGENSSLGGFLDLLDHFQIWRPEFAIGSIEPDGGATLAGSVDEVSLVMTATRRHADVAGGGDSILRGWNDRSRAWRAEGDGPLGTVASLGICEMTGVIRGERRAFLELFEQVAGPVQAIHFADEPVLPSAPVLTELTARTDAEREAIAADLVEYLARAKARPAEWIFAGAMLRGLQRTPLSEGYDILARGALRRLGPADAVVLSASAESGLARHRKLGYALSMNGFRVTRAGPNITAWVNAAFEPIRRTVDEVARDYRLLFAAIRGGQGRLPRHVLIVNLMSSAGDDDVQNYQAFDEPMGDVLASVRARDMNLMLYDLAREHDDVAIVDLDAITAEMGGQRNLPDGIHSSGALQAELRGEIVRILTARGAPGFAPAPIS